MWALKIKNNGWKVELGLTEDGTGQSWARALLGQ